MGKRRGRAKSKNMYRGPMGMDTRVGIDCESGMRVGRAGWATGKCGATVIEQ